MCFLATHAQLLAISSPSLVNLKRTVGSAQVEHTPQVVGHAWSTPLNAQRRKVSLFATQEQDLFITDPSASTILSLSALSTHGVTGDPVGDTVGDPVTGIIGAADGDAVGDAVGTKGAADGDGDGLMELVGGLDGAALSTKLGLSDGT